MQSNQCVVCFPTPCRLNREIEIVSPGNGITCIIQPRPQICGLLFGLLFVFCHIPCLIYFLSVSIPLRTERHTLIHLCVHFKCTGCLAEMLCTCLWERCAFRDIHHPPPALISLQECLEHGRLQKPRLPATTPGNLHTFPRALITCLPLTA